MALFHTFVDSAGEWRWHLKADNGRIIADSAEGYSSLAAVRQAAERVKEIAPDAEVD
ncbi:YegP family protein [Phycicoccus sp.]|uniref:YegP family protein n=1 Tax=Phycicoccus sp. TaxID=1902410 RepID=UPI002C00FFD8|nr:YegP family protein [Phycicoccus sp.]HMM94032.1 YegP family protein [Phycicoccus sp.]